MRATLLSTWQPLTDTRKSSRWSEDLPFRPPSATSLLAQVLLGYKADIEAKSAFEETPLHRAAYAGHVEVVEVRRYPFPDSRGIAADAGSP